MQYLKDNSLSLDVCNRYNSRNNQLYRRRPAFISRAVQFRKPHPISARGSDCRLQTMVVPGDPLRKTKRAKRGKGRKERMRNKIGKLLLENEHRQEKVKELASKT